MSEASPMASWGLDNIAILAYGSLATDAGADIEAHIVARIPCETPWPVEYARRSSERGGAPTLVRHPVGGIVRSYLLVLDLTADQEATARQWLRDREGKPPAERIRCQQLGGFRTVLYADLLANIPGYCMTAGSLASLAINSVHTAPPGKNGVRYLSDNIRRGIITPLTEAYQAAILATTGAGSLEQAEQMASHAGSAGAKE